MKQCKDELKFLPKRLMALNQTSLHKNEYLENIALLEEMLLGKLTESKEITRELFANEVNHFLIKASELKSNNQEQSVMSLRLDDDVKLINGFVNKLKGSLKIQEETLNIINELVERNREENIMAEEALAKETLDDTLSRIHDFFKNMELNQNNGKKVIIQPVDDSLGEIKDMIIGYTPAYNRNRESDEYKRQINAFNKIYTDLIIKLSRVNDGIPDETILKLFPVAQNLDSAEISLEEINCAIKKLAYFTGSYVNNNERLRLRVKDKVEMEDIWIQDDVIPVKLGDGNSKDEEMLIYGKRGDEKTTSDKVAALADIIGVLNKKRDSSFILPKSFVGGNILFVGKYILIGERSLIQSNMGKLYRDNKNKEILRLLFGHEKEIIIIGNGAENPLHGSTDTDGYAWLDNWKKIYQPLYHLDLFITPAGITKSGKYRLVIGEPVTKLKRDASELLERGGIFDRTREQVDAIAKMLENKGFKVSRIPMPLSWVDLVNNKGNIKRIWVLASYNNCIVQYVGRDNPKNLVFIPRYSGKYNYELAGYEHDNGELFDYDQIKRNYNTCIDRKCKKCNSIGKLKGGNWSELNKYERKVEKHWAKLGFRPVFFTNYMPLLIFRGALRCMTKVIEREKLTTKEQQRIVI